MPWQVIFVGWLILVIVPLVLGLAGFVKFHWVLLWEAVMFSPVLIPIGFYILLKPGPINTQKVRDMYIPKFPKGR